MDKFVVRRSKSIVDSHSNSITKKMTFDADSDQENAIENILRENSTTKNEKLKESSSKNLSQKTLKIKDKIKKEKIGSPECESGYTSNNPLQQEDLPQDGNIDKKVLNESDEDIFSQDFIAPNLLKGENKSLKMESGKSSPKKAITVVSKNLKNAYSASSDEEEMTAHVLGKNLNIECINVSGLEETSSSKNSSNTRSENSPPKSTQPRKAFPKENDNSVLSSSSDEDDHDDVTNKSSFPKIKLITTKKAAVDDSIPLSEHDFYENKTQKKIKSPVKQSSGDYKEKTQETPSKFSLENAKKKPIYSKLSLRKKRESSSSQSESDSTEKNEKPTSSQGKTEEKSSSSDDEVPSSQAPKNRKPSTSSESEKDQSNQENSDNESYKSNESMRSAASEKNQLNSSKIKRRPNEKVSETEQSESEADLKHLRTICDEESEDDEKPQSNIVIDEKKFKNLYPQYKEMSYNTELILNQLTDSNNEVYLIECPKKLKPHFLTDQIIDFNNIKSPLFVNKIGYECKKIDNENKMVNIIASTTNKRVNPKLERVPIKGTLSISESLTIIKPERVTVDVPSDKVLFPTNLNKQRHPLLGTEYKNLANLDPDITKNLNNAIKIKEKALKKEIKRRSLQIQKPTPDHEKTKRSFEYDEFIGNLSNDLTSTIKRTVKQEKLSQESGTEAGTSSESKAKKKEVTTPLVKKIKKEPIEESIINSTESLNKKRKKHSSVSENIDEGKSKNDSGNVSIKKERIDVETSISDLLLQQVANLYPSSNKSQELAEKADKSKTPKKLSQSITETPKSSQFKKEKTPTPNIKGDNTTLNEKKKRKSDEAIEDESNNKSKKLKTPEKKSTSPIKKNKDGKTQNLSQNDEFDGDFSSLIEKLVNEKKNMKPEKNIDNKSKSNVEDSKDNSLLNSSKIDKNKTPKKNKSSKNISQNNNEEDSMSLIEKLVNEKRNTKPLKSIEQKESNEIKPSDLFSETKKKKSNKSIENLSFCDDSKSLIEKLLNEQKNMKPAKVIESSKSKKSKNSSMISSNVEKPSENALLVNDETDKPRKHKKKKSEKEKPEPISGNEGNVDFSHIEEFPKIDENSEIIPKKSKKKKKDKEKLEEIYNETVISSNLEENFQNENLDIKKSKKKKKHKEIDVEEPHVYNEKTQLPIVEELEDINEIKKCKKKKKHKEKVDIDEINQELVSTEVPIDEEIISKKKKKKNKDKLAEIEPIIEDTSILTKKKEKKKKHTSDAENNEEILNFTNQDKISDETDYVKKSKKKKKDKEKPEAPESVLNEIQEEDEIPIKKKKKKSKDKDKSSLIDKEMVQKILENIVLQKMQALGSEKSKKKRKRNSDDDVDQEMEYYSKKQKYAEDEEVVRKSKKKSDSSDDDETRLQKRIIAESVQMFEETFTKKENRKIRDN